MNDELFGMNLEQFKKFIAPKLIEMPEQLLEILADNMINEDNNLVFKIPADKIMRINGKSNS